MTDQELQDVLSHKPILTDPREKIKYAVFIALIQRGWKGVASEYSGVLTKNNFVLTLFKSDSTRFILREPNPYLVPTAISYFQVPRANWVLERYNKLYDSGKVQLIWDYLYDEPETMTESNTFMKFIEQVDTIASKHELELQCMGSSYTSEKTSYLSFSAHDGSITDTGIFMSLVDFGSVKKKVAYKIEQATVLDGDRRVFVLSQLEPPSSLETIVDADDFNANYVNGNLVPLNVIQHEGSEEFYLVASSGASMGGLPVALQKLNFSMDKQGVIGEAIVNNLYVIPLLKLSDESAKIALELLKETTEYQMLNQLPDDPEYLRVLLDYARAGYSLYKPLESGIAGDAAYELTELLDFESSAENDLRQEYTVAMVELIRFLRTHYLSTEYRKNELPNYCYLRMMQERGILKNLTHDMLSNTMMNADGVLFLHKAYANFVTTNEVRSLFFEPGMEDFFEPCFAESVHFSFDWREGFGMDCANYSLVRVPCGYKVLDSDRVARGFILKVNDEIFTYGDLSVIH